MALAQIARCSGTPPRLWRHWGCEHWHCGDLGGAYEGCRQWRSGTECAPPSWSCSGEGEAAFERIQAEGSFACVGTDIGRWADILPLCVGDTAPGLRTGTWKSSSRVVRAVLFQANISWTAPTSYRPDICTGRAANCRRLGFGELLEANLWPLVAEPLQDALCAPDLSNNCVGTVSRYGDRLRVAGVAGDVAPGEGSLLVYFEAVAVLAEDVERLEADIGAWSYALHSNAFTVNASDIWDAIGRRRDVSASSWFRDGLAKLRHEPRSFSIRTETEFNDAAWFPTWRLLVSEPFIINRRMLPDWRQKYQAVEPPDSMVEFLTSLRVMEQIVLHAVCWPLGVVWLFFLSMRVFGWRFLFGSRSHWQFAETARGVSIVAILTDVAEMAVVFTVFSAAAWLSVNDIFADAAPMDFRRPQLGALLLPFPIAIVMPSFVLTFQFLKGGKGSDPLPKRIRLCGIRVRKRSWIRLFLACVAWHGLVIFGVTALVLLRLTSDSAGNSVQSARREAVVTCEADVAERCEQDLQRQIPVFTVEQRQFCAQDCSTVPTPLIDVAVRFEIFVYRLEVAAATWSLLVRFAQLAVGLQLSDAHLRASSQRAAASDAEDAESAFDNVSASRVVDAADSRLSAAVSASAVDPLEEAEAVALSLGFGRNSKKTGPLRLPPEQPSLIGISDGDAWERSSLELPTVVPPLALALPPGAQESPLNSGRSGHSAHSGHSRHSGRSGHSGRSKHSGRSGGGHSGHSGRSSKGVAFASNADEDQSLGIETDIAELFADPRTLKAGDSRRDHSSKRLGSGKAVAALVPGVEGNERSMLDFAQIIARSVSKDTIGSASARSACQSARSQTFDVQDDDVIQGSEVQDRTGVHSKTSKKRYVADW